MDEPYAEAKAGDLFRRTGSGVTETAGAAEYAILASDIAAPDKKVAGVDDPIKAAGVEETYDPSRSGAGVEDPMKVDAPSYAAALEKPLVK